MSSQPQESPIQAGTSVDSFKSANTFPVKMLNTRSWFNDDGSLNPTHLQLNITNACNLTCKFCSCADRDLSQWQTKEHILSEMSRFKSVGGRGVTIAGGGDPTVHPNFEEIINSIDSMGIKIGLVTNAIRLDKFSIDTLKKLTWCRISLSYCNPFRQKWIAIFESAPHVDWAFSYVYTGDRELCQKAINASKQVNITHFRIVCDINKLELLPLPKFENDNQVIYQPRETFTHGAKKCYISIVKPYLDTDGAYYPCCGVQFAKEKPALLNERKVDLTMSMGTDLVQFAENKVPFDGSGCTKCYYGDYNDLIARIVESDSPAHEYEKLSCENKQDLIHMEFL